MGEYYLSNGEPIILGTQLEDGDDTKYVKAIAKTHNNLPIAGSPFSLTHTSDGFYSYYDIINLIYPSDPALESIRVTYIVYNDPGFTEESTDHLRGLDIFRRASDGSATDLTEVNNKLDQILNQIPGANIIEPGFEIVVIVEDNELSALIEDSNPEIISMQLEEPDEIIATFDNLVDINAEIEDELIVTIIEE